MSAGEQLAAIADVLLHGDGPETAEDQERALRLIRRIVCVPEIRLANPSERIAEGEIARALAEHREQPWMVLPPAVGLSSPQLRGAAEALRRRYSPPSVAMSPGEYLVHEGLRALADALEDVAAVQTEGGS